LSTAGRAAAVALAALALVAAFAPLAAAAEGAAAGTIWEAQAVRFPVRPELLSPSAPFDGGQGEDVRGPVKIAPGRAAAFRLGPVSFARVRVVAGNAEAVSFGRLVRGEGDAAVRSSLLAEERPQSLGPGRWYLVQPPPVGTVWFIQASEPVTVVVERAVQRSQRLVWVTVRDQVFRWIDGAGELPALPASRGASELLVRLRADEALARIAEGHFGKGEVGPALRLWRKASADVALSKVRRLHPPYMVASDLAGGRAGFGDTEQIYRGSTDRLHSGDKYHRVNRPRARWRVTLTGPGVIDLSVRAVWPENRRERILELSVAVDGVEVAHDRETRSPLRVTRDDHWKQPFPAYEPLVTGRGERVSPKQTLVVPLLLGTHTYEFDVRGGPMLVDARLWRRRPRLRGLVGGTQHAGRLASRALERAPAAADPRDFLEALVGTLEGKRATVSADWPPLLELALLARGVAYSDPRRPEGRAAVLDRAAELIASLSPDDDPDLVAASQIDLAGAGRRWGLGESVEDLLSRSPVPLRPAAVAAFALAVPEKERAGRRSRTLAGVMAAWAQRPLEGAIRSTLLRLWFDRTGWSSLTPTQANAEASRERWWFRPARPLRRELADHRIVALASGRAQAIDVGRLTTAPNRPGRVRLFAVGPPGATATVRVGTETFPIAMEGRAAVLELAVAPGPHEVELTAGAGVMAFVAVPRERSGVRSERAQATRSRWRLGPDAPLDFVLPDRGLPGLIRLELRAPSAPGTEPIELGLSIDGKPPRKLLLRPGSVDPTWMPQRGARRVSGAVDATLWLPDDAGTVRITSDAPVWCSFAIRRADAAPAAASAAEPAEPEAAEPFDDPATIDLARHDRLQLDDAVSHPARRPYSVRHFVNHLAARGGATHWPFQPDWEPVELVWPARGALLRASPQADLWLERYDRATALDREGRHLVAARALAELARDSGVWQVAVEAIAAARRRLPRRLQDRVLLYSLALDLATRATLATVWRGVVELSRNTRSERLRGWDAPAGFARVFGGRSARERGPRSIFGHRGASPPWPSDVALPVRSGARSSGRVRAFEATELRLRVWCRPLDGAETCRLRWRIGGDASGELEAKPDSIVFGPPVAVAVGEHAVEVEFASGRGLASAAVVDPDGKPMFEPRRRRFELAAADNPASVAVVGPAVLWIEGRSAGAAGELRISAAPSGSDSGPALRTVVSLPGARDATVTMEDAAMPVLRKPGYGLLTLPRAGRYRLSVEPDAGVAGLRVTRVAAIPEPAAGSETPGVAPEARPAAPASAWAGSELGLLGDATPPTPRSLPTTLSLATVAGIDDRTGRGDDDDRLQNRFEVTARWRHQLAPSRWWVGAQLGMRALSDSTSFNVGADTYVRGLPLGVRLNGRARVYVQDYADRLESRILTRARFDRSLSFLPTTFGIPAVSVQLSHYSLTEGDLVDGTAPDPLVFTNFGTTHDKSIALDWTQFWTPFVDQTGWAMVRVTSNEDLTTVDRFDALVGWRGVIEVGDLSGPEYRVVYRPTLRIADLDRRESFVRHDILLRFDWTVWTGRAGRFVFSLDNDLYLSTEVASRAAVRVGVRFDWTGQRSLRDLPPTERDFEDIIEHRLWGAYR